MVENQVDRKLKTLRTDNELEFCNADFNNFYNQKGIARHRIVKHAPRQNWVAKIMNRTLMIKVKSMLISSGLGFLG